MTLAQEIKKAINIEKELPTLRKIVKNRIENDGQYTVICDTHIVESDPSFALQNKYFVPLCEWASKEGLQSYVRFNSSGVRKVVLTLK